ncbi:hypothetical protein [Aeromonas simiae]|uniref:PsiF repeat-containing protein n=1 Tax=Aeromonas simiae TaxID=218936 RepID=A0A5J6WTZ5_9GAMM|nr:hypothetical protein [Aeromonas simiae]QFI53651.1 hypothetical protein FE240_02365 [Aeromonas simiae]
MKIALPLLMSLCAFGAVAAEATRPTPPDDLPQISAEMKAAFNACKESGRPGGEDFDSCMASKGFAKPEGRGEPPADENQAGAGESVE